MDLDKLDRINIEMKDGSTWLGEKVIKGVTRPDIAVLAFEHQRAMIVVNWCDVKAAKFYEGED